MWNNIKIFFRWFRKVMKMNIAFGWFWPLLKFFLFEWRFADWPWNVVILLRMQVPVPYFDLIFGICETCRCEIMWSLISGSALVFAFFFERNTASCFRCCVFCQNDDVLQPSWLTSLCLFFMYLTLLCRCLLLNLFVICLCLSAQPHLGCYMCLVEHTHSDGTPSWSV